MVRKSQAMQERGVRLRAARKAGVSVERLEERALMTWPGYPMPTVPPVNPPPPSPPITVPAPVTPAPTTQPVYPPGPSPGGAGSKGQHTHRPTGIVTKTAHFYQFYTGPRLAELNAVRASGILTKQGSFVFTGTNKGRINQAPAVYVWGIDRSGNLPSGPFTGRPNIKFDALVVVSIDASLQPKALVLDLATGAMSNLPAGSASIHGKTISVTVPASLLPSTGLALSQYRYNYWPEDGGPPVSSSVASFAPEFNTVQVGASK
jgi:hypothetical protein